jgi:hypothetical protein
MQYDGTQGDAVSAREHGDAVDTLSGLRTSLGTSLEVS